MAREPWRRADVVVVPDVVGMHIRDADRVAQTAGLKLAQPDPDGPPLAALTWPDDYWVTGQRPSSGSRLWRSDSLVVTWSASPGETGVREPRRPVVPLRPLGGVGVAAPGVGRRGRVVVSSVRSWSLGGDHHRPK